jgi:hypothetical protein
MNTKFISWLEQQNYSILKKWDSNDGNYRRTLILYTTKKRMDEEGKWQGEKILKYKWGEILNKNLLSGWN